MGTERTDAGGRGLSGVHRTRMRRRSAARTTPPGLMQATRLQGWGLVRIGRTQLACGWTWPIGGDQIPAAQDDDPSGITSGADPPRAPRLPWPSSMGSGPRGGTGRVASRGTGYDVGLRMPWCAADRGAKNDPEARLRPSQGLGLWVVRRFDPAARLRNRPRH